MKIKSARLIIASAAILFTAADSFAWKSLSYLSTHERITTQLVTQLDGKSYHDIARTAHLLIGGSSLEDGHERVLNGGGKIKDWWDGKSRDDEGTETYDRPTLRNGVFPNYLNFMFERAYTNLGVMCHLTQDQAVPSHAAHIPHSSLLSLPSDGMEVYAAAHPDFAQMPAIDNNRPPYEYYQVLQDETLGNLPRWVNPDTGKPYWSVLPPPVNRLSGMFAVNFGPEGSYGAYDGMDSYLKNADPKSPEGIVARSPEICREQLARAAGYTKAMLESASKALPPLVRNLAISSNLLSPGQGMAISFLPLENRSMKVAYEITVSKNGAAPMPVLSGTAQLVDLGGYLYETLKPVKLSWDGLVSGMPLEEGTYILEVMLTDEDGNKVPGEVNSDPSRENDTKAVFSVVKPASEDAGQLSLDF
jgi:hypothetical protein